MTGSIRKQPTRMQVYMSLLCARTDLRQNLHAAQEGRKKYRPPPWKPSFFSFSVCEASMVYTLLSGPMLCTVFLCFPRNGIHHSFFGSVTSGSGNRPRKFPGPSLCHRFSSIQGSVGATQLILDPEFDLTDSLSLSLPLSPERMGRHYYLPLFSNQ